MPITPSVTGRKLSVANSNLYSHEHYWYSATFTGAALPSVSPINAGFRHAENAAPCTVARDVTEVTWSFLTAARP
jgi:hypothetical protein